MTAFTTLLLAYVFGGLTFLPLVAACLFLHAYFALPRRDLHPTQESTTPEEPEDVSQALREKLDQPTQEAGVAASYFAVCREFVPGGVNGKPPERTTPAGETIAAESPSVYQSMYRSIFDRNKSQSPSLEAGKAVKKARNVFYVVLRHGHLLLFDNDNQLEVRHVIPLANYNVDIYAGGEDIPEGELFIRRNCIRLVRKAGSQSMPYYLFSDNCSDKEDFYHALLHGIETGEDAEGPAPVVQEYETEDMIKLIRQLHLSEENVYTRWINALLGRVFLAVYKTETIEQLIRQKLTKKMSRVPKPNFITSLRLHEISMGDSAPLFTSPKLREMNVDGGLTVEADVKYSGNFKIVIAAIARIELGSRFKAREVSLVLAGVLKRLEGHLLIRIKPPPSNRVWVSFETMPKVDLSIEPIVSSRQITYGVILRAIESRIREVIGETMVLPNWDDHPFLDTMQSHYRGGIWQSEHRAVPQGKEELVTEESKATAETVAASATESLGPEVNAFALTAAHQAAVPSTEISPKRVNSMPPALKSHQATSSEGSSSPRTKHSGHSDTTKPKVLRSNSFATAAIPIVSKTPSAVESSRPLSMTGSRNAANAMKILHQRSPEASPAGSPAEPLPKELLSRGSRSSSVTSDVAAEPSLDTGDDDLMLPFASDDLGDSNRHEEPKSQSPVIGSMSSSPEKSTSFIANGASTGHQRSASGSTPVKRASLNAQINSATAAAKQWSWGVLKQASVASTPSRPPRPSTQEPMGRGQPLPPPGVPLPKPESGTWSAAAINTFRRKPVPARQMPLPKDPSRESLTTPSSASSISLERPTSSRETLRPLPTSSSASEETPHTETDSKPTEAEDAGQKDLTASLPEPADKSSDDILPKPDEPDPIPPGFIDH